MIFYRPLKLDLMNGSFDLYLIHDIIYMYAEIEHMGHFHFQHKKQSARLVTSPRNTDPSWTAFCFGKIEPNIENQK